MSIDLLSTEERVSNYINSTKRISRESQINEENLKSLVNYVSTTYRNGASTRDHNPSQRINQKTANSVHSVHESKPIKSKSSLSSGKVQNEMFTKRNSSGQQWMRYEQGIFSAIKNSKKVFSLDEHTGEFSSRNKVKNSIVVRPTAPNTTQKASTKAKVNKSPRKTNLKMMTLVKGVKMMEKSGQKEHTPIPFKLDSSQQYYNKHLYNINSPANADQNKLMVSMSM